MIRPYMNISNSESTLSATINLLRFPLTLAVVFIHANHGPAIINDLVFSELSSHDFFGLFAGFIVYWVACAAVPLFFFISGLLYFYNVKQLNYKTYKEKTKKRFFSLCIPYLIWNSVALLMAGLYSCFTMTGSINSTFLFEQFLKFDWIQAYWYEDSNNLPVLYALWFVRDLIVISLLSPIFYLACKYYWGIFLSIISICYFTGNWFGIPGLGLSGCFYFYLGALLSIKGWAYIEKASKATLPALSLSIFFFVYKTYDTFHGGSYTPGPVGIFLNSLTIFLLAYLFCSRSNFQFPSILIKSTMFVYCWHGLSLIGGMAIVNKVMELSGVPNAIIFWTIPFIVYFISTSFYYILNRYMPRFYHIICGR